MIDSGTFFLLNTSNEKFVSWPSDRRFDVVSRDENTLLFLYDVLSKNWSGHRVAFVSERGGSSREAKAFRAYRNNRNRSADVDSGEDSDEDSDEYEMRAPLSLAHERNSYPRRVIFHNLNKNQYVDVDVGGGIPVDEFTTAALVWLLVDPSRFRSNDVVRAAVTLNPWETLSQIESDIFDRHGGAWAFDRITAYDSSEFEERIIGDGGHAPKHLDVTRLSSAFEHRAAVSEIIANHEKARDELEKKLRDVRTCLDAPPKSIEHREDESSREKKRVRFVE